MLPDCFALLDDRDATPAHPTSRLYRGFAHEHRCTDPATLDAMWQRVEADQRGGLHAVLLADYEWGARLLQAGTQRLAGDAALRVLMFRDLDRLSAEGVAQWLEVIEPGPPFVAGVMNLAYGVDRDDFNRAIASIHAAIAAGETYQVNYTYRIHAQAFGSPLALYRRLRERQPVAYGAFIALPAPAAAAADQTSHVLSCSPELFLRHADGLLTARPMKGTAGRVAGAEGDSETARHLSIDTKNRAENVMIVDLLRNDLGRLAVTGSVTVPELFVVEPYSTLFQLTSTVRARPRPEVGMADVLRATFPCGSITGAPKHHTMELIAELETTPRGLYCGAIGWVDAPQGGQRCGDFCLSVAIRTLTLGAARDGLGPARLGVGAGIVADSRADDEFDECRLKARFLTGLDPGFALFETMRATREGGVEQVDRHLSRLAKSAGALGFGFDRAALLEALRQAVETLPTGRVSRLRLELDHAGRATLASAPLAPLPDGPAGLLIAPAPLPDARPLAGHKTTAREAYDAGVRAAEDQGGFDTLFFSRSGRLVEGGRSNVFACIDTRWWTPPLTDGALPGVMRGVLLEDREWGAAERSLTLADLQAANALVVCNALRGALPARLV